MKGWHIGKRGTRTLKDFAIQVKENYSNLCNFAALLILEDVVITRLPFCKEIKQGHFSNRELVLSTKPLFPQGANRRIEKPLLSPLFRIVTQNHNDWRLKRPIQLSRQPPGIWAAFSSYYSIFSTVWYGFILVV